MADKNYDEFEFSVVIRATRKTGSYHENRVVDIERKQTFVIAAARDSQMRSELATFVDDAVAVALQTTELRQDFERNMLALESGDVIDA